MSNKSPDYLIKAYHSATEHYNDAKNERYAVILALTYINDPRVTKIITQALTDDDAFMRLMAAQTLAARRFRPSPESWHDAEDRLRYIKILTRLIEEGQEKDFGRSHACMTCIALASVGGIEVIHLLMQTLTHTNPDLRHSARQGLSILLLEDEEAAMPHLLRALDSDNLLTRTGAAWAVCNFDAMHLKSGKVSRLVVSQLEEGLELPELAKNFQYWLDKLNGVVREYISIE